MHIAVHDYAGHPFQIQLSRELARRGHDVIHYFCGHNNTPKGDLVWRRGDPATLKIKPVFTRQPLQKYNLAKRWLQEIEYGQLLVKELAAAPIEILISANTPLDSLNIVQAHCIKHRVAFTFWVQDLVGLASYKILSQKLPLLGWLIARYYITMERKILNKSDALVFISENFSLKTKVWIKNHTIINTIPNWAPIEHFPIKEKNNPWAKLHGINDKFCFLYTGTLGMKHNPGLLLKLAEHFRLDSHVCVLVISEGPGADWLVKKKEEKHLDNLLVTGYQPYDRMPEVLASGDVLVTILLPEAGEFSVPSKVLTNLCAERPQLLAVPPENLAAQIIQENHAGVVTSPEDQKCFLDLAEKLYYDQSQNHWFGKNARAYAEKHFDIFRITNQFEAIINQTVTNSRKKQ